MVQNWMRVDDTQGFYSIILCENFFVVCYKSQIKWSLLQIMYVCFCRSKSSVYASWLHVFYHSLWSTCSVSTEVSTSWKTRNQLILNRERAEEACFLYPDYSKNTWSGKFDTYCQQILSWKIRSCGFCFLFYFFPSFEAGSSSPHQKAVCIYCCFHSSLFCSALLHCEFG